MSRAQPSDISWTCAASPRTRLETWVIWASLPGHPALSTWRRPWLLGVPGNLQGAHRSSPPSKGGDGTGGCPLSQDALPRGVPRPEARGRHRESCASFGPAVLGLDQGGLEQLCPTCGGCLLETLCEGLPLHVCSCACMGACVCLGATRRGERIHAVMFPRGFRGCGASSSTVCARLCSCAPARAGGASVSHPEREVPAVTEVPQLFADHPVVLGPSPGRACAPLICLLGPTGAFEVLGGTVCGTAPEVACVVGDLQLL